MAEKLCACGTVIPARYRKCEDCLVTKPVAAGVARRPRAEVRVWDESREHLVASEARWVDLSCGCRVWTCLLPTWRYDRSHGCEEVVTLVMRVSAEQPPDPTTPSMETLLAICKAEGHENLWLPGVDVDYRGEADLSIGLDVEIVEVRTADGVRLVEQPRESTRGGISNRTNREAREVQR